MKDYQDIPDPSPDEINKYLQKWDRNDEYKRPEEALVKLFQKTYPKNNDIDNVLIKMYALNNAYSAGVLSNHFVSIAKHIVEIKIDSGLRNGQLEVVERIRNTKRNYYSFATKYCSFHNPEAFPMFDLRIVRALTFFRRQSCFETFTQDELRDYKRFHSVVSSFRSHYRLESFSFREIDKYLWLLYEMLETRRIGKIK